MVVVELVIEKFTISTIVAPLGSLVIKVTSYRADSALHRVVGGYVVLPMYEQPAFDLAIHQFRNILFMLGVEHN